MDLAIALIGLVGAILGLVAALVSRRREIVHRHQAYEDSPRPSRDYSPGDPTGPGALVFRSTLFGFAIGTFFGVAALGFWLVLADAAQVAPNEVAALRLGGVMSLLISGVLGTLLGLHVGMKLAGLVAGENRRRDAEPRNQAMQQLGDAKDGPPTSTSIPA